MPEEPQALHADERRLAARMVAVGTSAIRRFETSLKRLKSVKSRCGAVALG